MIIDNFDLVGMAILPYKTNPELLVYPNGILIFPFTPKVFQTISRWDCEFADFSNTIDLVKLAPNNRPQVTRAATPRFPRVPAVKNVFRTLVVKGLYHISHYNDYRYTRQRLGISA
ncbi:uncharacterized protein Dmul_33880 [Desulfococcus multivorans]|nr:uncharacterized protein Dmul_33880 [Desulfococcus multivorans]